MSGDSGTTHVARASRGPARSLEDQSAGLAGPGGVGTVFNRITPRHGAEGSRSRRLLSRYPRNSQGGNQPERAEGHRR